jgi:hypothetical protein
VSLLHLAARRPFCKKKKSPPTAPPPPRVVIPIPLVGSCAVPPTQPPPSPSFPAACPLQTSASDSSLPLSPPCFSSPETLADAACPPAGGINSSLRPDAAAGAPPLLLRSALLSGVATNAVWFDLPPPLSRKQKLPQLSARGECELGLIRP